MDNDRVSFRNDDLTVDRAASVLRTRPPVGEEGEEVGCADGAVAVEVGGRAGSIPVHPNENSLPKAGCIQTAFVRYPARTPSE